MITHEFITKTMSEIEIRELPNLKCVIQLRHHGEIEILNDRKI